MVNEPFIGTSCSRFASHTRNAYEMKNDIIIIIIILFVHKNNFIKTRQPTTRERDRQG